MHASSFALQVHMQERLQLRAEVSEAVVARAAAEKGMIAAGVTHDRAQATHTAAACHMLFAAASFGGTRIEEVKTVVLSPDESQSV
jgi:hypothetical protein